ncbi:MAG TPA: hypothetical protein VG757_16290 [Devosia sp.]|nr:hypothetical protein [Devosia sp.]
MKLVKFVSPDGPIYINPEHVIAVRKGMRDTKVETVNGPMIVTEEVEVVARLLGAEEIARDVTPALPRSIDL